MGKGVAREGLLWPKLRGYWHPVAFAEDADDGPLAVTLLDERVAVCRIGGQVRAFRDLCVHRGTPVSLGWVQDDTLVCAYHGWAYREDGRCVRIPSIPPKHPIPKKACLTPYHATERYGLLWVCLAEKPRIPIPDVPEFEDPAYRVMFRQKKTWDCSAARAIENFFDLAHFPWIHEGILGDRDHPLAPEVNVSREGELIRVVVDNPADAVHPVAHKRNYRITRPFFIHQRKEEAGDKTETYIFTCLPHSTSETTRFMLMMRNFNLDTPEYKHAPYTMRGDEVTSPVRGFRGKLPKYVATHNQIGEQDRVIVERQRPEELPLDLAEEFHLKGPDAMALAYRRALGELGVEA
jgi:phenylpropionate dioxygenase-like ring-hydroxylating dioxygenase large terminal subunit